MREKIFSVFEVSIKLARLEVFLVFLGLTLIPSLANICLLFELRLA